VLVFATRGDLGEVDDGVLDPDEQLAARREDEARAAAAVLGAARVEFLPYHPTGTEKYRRLGREYLMTDTPSPDAASMAEIAAQMSAAGVPVKEIL